MPKRVRLDVAVVERGLERSRERARRLIVAGEVTVNGQVVRAPSTLVPADAALAVGTTMPYVSRGGLKLAHALDRFAIDPAGRICLDAGASTGGFTDVLLRRGAARVYAVDVGRGLLDWHLRQDARVVVMEGVNVRYLRLAREPSPKPAADDRLRTRDSEPGTVPDPQSGAGAKHFGRAPLRGGEESPGPSDREDLGPVLPEPVSLAVVDVAFISLGLVLPAIAGVLTGEGELVALVKPQFEAGRADVRKGIVRDPQVQRRVLRDVLQAARHTGLQPAGLTASPLRGQAGNVEFLLWARPAPAPTGFADAEAIEAALAEAPPAP
jgi:23S rRNA (cytidine1920-2'-O)/16S rRNA (cytidine1409-2'-O)-methyltransferase